MLSLNSNDQIFVKWLFEPETSCFRDQDVTTEPAQPQIREIFKMIPIHASVMSGPPKSLTDTKYN